ncbi:MAG: alpha-ribazole phosphatase family protein [Promethearchaeota archaeon]
MDILIARHTRVAVDPNLCYGTQDIPLADTFLEEAQAVKNRLKQWFPFDKVYSSPLTRAAKLAQFLQNGDITYDDRLKEIEFGPWEMITWEDIGLEKFSKWVEDVDENGPPTETYKDMTIRLKSFFDELIEKRPGEKILITTHSGAIRCILALYSGTPLSNIFQFRISFGGVLHLKFQEFSEEDYTKYPAVLLPRMSIKGFN